MSPRRRTSLFLDDDLFTGLKQLKDRDGIPEAEAMRRALRTYLTMQGVMPPAVRMLQVPPGAEVRLRKAARKRAATRKRA